MWSHLGKGVLAVAKWIGQIQAWLILSVFYFVLMAPIALVFKLLADPLRLRRGRRAAWFERPQPPADRLAWAKKQ